MSASAPGLASLADRLASRVALSPEDRDAIFALPHKIADVGPNTYLIREGARPQYCMLLLVGFVYRHKVVGDGGRQITAIHLRGDALDLHNAVLDVADHNVQTLTEASLCLVERGALADLALSRPAIGRAVWIETLVNAALEREWMVNIGRRDSSARIIHLLCELAVRQKQAGLCGEDDYGLPFTQEQLADATGLTAVHVNRVLQALSKEGVILRDKRTVTITDWKRTQALGDFNSRYLHLGQIAHPEPAEAAASAA